MLRGASRTVFIGACLLAALTAGVIALVSSLAGGTVTGRAHSSAVVPISSPAARVSGPSVLSDRARIYAAVLEHRLGRRYVIERECGDVGTSPVHRCTGRLIDPGTQRAVRALTGPLVQFGPARGALLMGYRGTVIGFGPLALAGSRARLAMEVFCGPDGGTGATYELARHAGAWLVTGTIRPQRIG
ncbi:MAG: hypothetical protein J0H43_07910 [Actinobacteria bacterium]|nr:hypothetical protein [Actinomycetota bacterium]